MAKICRQCGREFGNRSVRCSICEIDLDDYEIDNSEATRLQSQRMQQRQAQRTRQVQSRQPQTRQAQIRQSQSMQPHTRQVQGRQSQSMQVQTRQPQAGQMQNRQERDDKENIFDTVIDNGQKISAFTVKNILRVLSTVCLIMVFCPVFLVSCADDDIGVSVMTAVKGVSSTVYEEEVVAPQPVMLICLAIPIMILALLFFKHSASQRNGVIIALSGATDFVVWLIFKSAVKKEAKKNLCDFTTTGWYTLNMAILALIILLAVLVAMRILHMDDNPAAIVSRGGKKTRYG